MRWGSDKVAGWQRKSRLTLHLVVLLLGMTTAMEVRATGCVPTAGQSFFYNLPFSATMRLPANKPIGSILQDTGWVSPPSFSQQKFSCSDNYFIRYSYKMTSATNPLVPGSSDIIQTGIPGIGLRMWASADVSGGRPVAMTPWPGTYENYSTTPIGITIGPLPSMRAQLIVTGPISAGTTNFPASDPNHPIGFIDVSGRGMNTVSTAGWGNMYISNSVTVTAASCTINAPNNRAVNLAPVAANSFSAVGATAGSGSFTLSLNCMSGTKVYMTVTDSTNPGNTSNVLSLAAGSTATGVGYQLSHPNGVVSYGPDSNVAGNTNQFWVADVGGTNSTVNIPFSVKYVRTGTVGPGTANAVATYNVSYQ